MTAQLLSGKPIAERVLAQVKTDVEQLKKQGVIPGLGTILVGEDAASAGYVRRNMKHVNRLVLNHFMPISRQQQHSKIC